MASPVLSPVFEVPITFRLAEGQALLAALEVSWGLAVSPLLKKMGKKVKSSQSFCKLGEGCHPSLVPDKIAVVFSLHVKFPCGW